MKKGKISMKAISVFLAIMMIAALLPMSVFAAGVNPDNVTSGYYLISQTQYKIAPDIEETQFIVNNAEGKSQHMGYAVIVKMGGSASIIASYKNQDGTSAGLQTVRDQAAAAEQKRNVKVVAGVNSDIFNMQTGAPMGYLVMDNVTYFNNTNNQPYFAILNDGTAVIREAWEPLTDVKEACGLWGICIRDGVNVTPPGMGESDDPRTAVGIKADGSVVLMVVDGRQSPKSCGMTWSQVVDILIGMGCVIGGHFDGGGSSTFVSQHEGETGLTCRNSPSDGNERSVSSALLVTSSAKPTGEFDHAALTPNNEIYTPGSSVQFTASGVDSAGGNAPLPEDGKFVLTDDSFGEIDEDGLFVSNGTVGIVTVNYVVGETVVGEISIEIAIPDELYVPNSEISLGFEETTDFNIIAKNQNRTVHLKPGDLIWSIKDDADNDLNGVAGTFDDLTFTSADGITVNANVTATLASDANVTVTVRVIIGAMPVVLYDMEYTTDAQEAANNPELQYIPSTVMPKYDKTSYSSYTVQAAEEYTKGYPFITWPNATLNNDPQYMTAEIVSKDDNEPVRFGNHSLKISFDFSGYDGSKNGNCYLRTTIPDYQFEGTPTAIGCWMYIPEGITASLKIYLQVANKNYSMAYGIVGDIGDWTGWKYIELDLTDPSAGSNLGPANAPFTTYTGNGILWISYQPGIGGTSAAATIYVDNFQLVYGANTDDIDNPIVRSVRVGDTEIVNNETVLTSNVNTFKASYADFDGKYKTGIDFDEVYMHIDGVDVTDKCYINEGDEEIYYYDAELADGMHNISITATDKFGNSTTETRSFRVESGSDATIVRLVEANGAPALGGRYEMDIVADDMTDITSANMAVSVASNYTKYWKSFDVVAGKNYTLQGEPTFNSVDDSINFKVTRNADADQDDDFIAKVMINVPKDVPKGLSVTYKVSKGELTYASERSEKFVNGFSDQITTECESPFVIAVDTMVVGSAGGYIHVADNDGNVVEKAAVYTVANELIGETDENGSVFTDQFIDTIQEFSIYAEKDGLLTFIYDGQSYPAGGEEDGTPSFVKLNASVDPATMQSISWMSSPLTSGSEVVVQYAEKAEYEANGTDALRSFAANSVVSEMSTSGSYLTNYAVRINNALITGLKPNTEYVYTVGDGEKMSELKNFRTSQKNAAVNFFVIGDTQATDTTNTDEITKNLAASGVVYDFGIQTGDAVDGGGNYTYWANIAKVFAGDFLGEQDLIHVLGNHEYYGDANAHNSAAYYNLPDTAEDGTAPAYYSVQYGNVYVAVVSYGYFKEAAEWIVEDANASDATWKILAMHQPAYFTNASAATAGLQETVAAMVDAAGIDFVFSGHDHSYARTEPMTAGEVDKENGAVYFICGSTGEKSYEIVSNDAHHFAMLNGEYNAIYLTVSATDTDFDITVREYTENGEDVIIDSYSKTKAITCTEDGTHDCLYENGYLTCKVCGYTSPVGTYTGLIKEASSGKIVYLYLGKLRTNSWLPMGDDIYFVDENGYIVTGKHSVTESLKNARSDVEEFLFDGKETTLEYTFDDEGKLIRGALVYKNSAKYYVYSGVVQFGWRNIDGDWYYFDGVRDAKHYGKALTGEWTRNSTRYICDSTGKLTNGFVYKDVGGIKYFWADDYVTGWQAIDGKDWNGNRLTGTFYFNPADGYMITDSAVIDGKEYFFNENGTLANGLTDTKDGKLYCTDGLVSASGWKTIDGKDYYFDPDNNNYAVVNDCVTLDGTTYAFDTDGVFRHYESHDDIDGDGACDYCDLAATDMVIKFFDSIKSILDTFKKIIELFNRFAVEL